MPWPAITYGSSNGWTNVRPRSACTFTACAYASLYDSPAWITSTVGPPCARTASTFTCGVVTGTTIIAFTFIRAAENATPCAWLPADAVITPRASASAGMCAILLYAPRSLNENTGWLSSRFR
ncbi:hypothetical protein X992_6295 [Burkholderia pseudomallei MSHR5492]|nr:hypothetical protein X992_6295 [Burkholderia pseudomallei MSHR5492]